MPYVALSILDQAPNKIVDFSKQVTTVRLSQQIFVDAAMSTTSCLQHINQEGLCKQRQSFEAYSQLRSQLAKYAQRVFEKV